jgi:thiol:disulfide interchange protein DsbA
MKNLNISTRWLLATVLAMVSGLLQAQSEPYQAGIHYTVLENAPAVSDGQIELFEAFSYLCSHCNTFEPYISSWKNRKPENVKFTRIPVVFGRGNWELYARGYVTAQTMGIGDEAHSAMMDRLWKEKKVMRSMDEIADFYAGFGVTADAFLATSKSFAVDARMRKEQRMAMDWQIKGTPSLVLSGKYRIEGNTAVPSYDVMLDIVDYLIAKESAAALVASAANAELEEAALNAELNSEAAAAAEAQVEDIAEQ